MTLWKTEPHHVSATTKHVNSDRVRAGSLCLRNIPGAEEAKGFGASWSPRKASPTRLFRTQRSQVAVEVQQIVSSP